MSPVKQFAAAAGALALAALALAVPARAIDIQQVTSPLGIQAWLVEDHSIPLFSMDYSFKGGSSQEPTAKRGIANMLANLLDEGAGDLDSTAFETKLEDQSISMDFRSRPATLLGPASAARAITDDRDEAVQLLTLALTIAAVRPASPSSASGRRFFSISATAIATRANRRRSRSTRRFSPATSTACPRPVPHRQHHLHHRQPNLRAFQKRMMARDNLQVAVVGDIDPKALGTMLDQIFGTLPAKADLTPVPAAPPPQPQYINVSVPTAAQTSLRFAGSGPLRNDPNYLAAYVAAFILGGGTPGTRLYDAIRVQRGLTYSIGLGLDTADHAGWFIGTTSTRADQADEVQKLVQDQIKQFADQGPTADELASAKAYLIGSYPLRFVTTGQEADQMMGVLTANLGIDYINQRNDLIAAISLDDVKREAKQLFSGDMLISRVGPPS